MTTRAINGNCDLSNLFSLLRAPNRRHAKFITYSLFSIQVNGIY